MPPIAHRPREEFSFNHPVMHSTRLDYDRPPVPIFLFQIAVEKIVGLIRCDQVNTC